MKNARTVKLYACRVNRCVFVIQAKTCCFARICAIAHGVVWICIAAFPNDTSSHTANIHIACRIYDIGFRVVAQAVDMTSFPRRTVKINRSVLYHIAVIRYAVRTKYILGPIDVPIAQFHGRDLSVITVRETGLVDFKAVFVYHGLFRAALVRVVARNINVLGNAHAGESHHRQDSK